MQTMPRPTLRPATPISPPGLARVVAAYFHTDAVVPAVAFAPLCGGAWGSLELHGANGSFSLSQTGEVVLTIDGRVGGFAPRQDAPAVFELGDGSRLTTPEPFITGQGGSIGVDRPPRFTTEVLLSEWRWSTGRVSAAWVGILHGPSFRAYNMLVQSHNRTSLQGLRLQGNATWHLIRKDALGKRRCIVVVGGDGADLSPAALAQDFCALEFLFGSALRLDLLVGVDDANVPVEALGTSLGYRFREGSSRGPPLPDERDHTWMAVAFPRLVAALGPGSLAAPTSAAVCNYVDSTLGHIDGEYLVLQIAIEALSNQLLKDEPPLVTNVKAWKGWVDSLTAQCEAHAVDAAALSVLLGKLRGAYRPTTSRLVEKTLKRSGLLPPAEALDEIEGRNVVAHTGSMTGGEAYDVERDLRRIRMLRSLLAALVLRTAGYDGQLLGWDLDETSGRKVAEWFLASDGAREESRLVYEVDLRTLGCGGDR